MMRPNRNGTPYESVLAVTLLLLLIHYYRFYEQPEFLVGSMLFIFLCLLNTKLAHWVARVWEWLTYALGKVMNTLLLSLVFLCLLTPLAIVYRLFSRNNFYKSSERESYFIKREHSFQREDLEHPW